MNSHRLHLHGELYLTLETVAECYHIEISWVREVYDQGLLGEGANVRGSIAIAASMLDRFAEVQRLRRQTGLDLVAIAAMLSR